ncbi:MAG: extracellular solute-binding protein, partial [Pseudomonadota bacterium]
KAWWQNKDFNKTILTPPVNSGPYRITEVSVGRRVVFERNHNYWGKDLPVYKGLNNFDRMVFDYFRDQTTAFESFKKGDVDVWTDMDPGHWSNAYQFPAKQNGSITQESLKHGRVEKMWGFIFNLRRPPFDDIRVREALSLMIDYDWLNRNNIYNQYTPLSSFFSNSDLKAVDKPNDAEKFLLQPFASTLPASVFENAWAPPASGNQQTLRQNQRKADALLNDAGWKIVDGQRINVATRNHFEFEILVSNLIDEKMALAFKRNLAKLGITVTLRSLDSAAFQDRLTGYDYDMTVYWWLNTLSPGTEQAIYWGCDAAKQNGRFNYSGICHPAIENLIAKIPNAKSREEMQTMTRALDRILTWEHIAIPLFYSGRDNVAAWAGFQHPAHTALYGNVMESWFLKQSPTKQH